LIGKIIIGVLSWIIFDELYKKKGDTDNETDRKNGGDSGHRNPVDGAHTDNKEHHGTGDLNTGNQKPINGQGEKENEQHLHTGESFEIAGSSGDGGSGELLSTEADSQTETVIDPQTGTGEGEKENVIQDDLENGGGDGSSYVRLESDSGAGPAGQADIKG